MNLIIFQTSLILHNLGVHELLTFARKEQLLLVSFTTLISYSTVSDHYKLLN